MFEILTAIVKPLRLDDFADSLRMLATATDLRICLALARFELRSTGPALTVLKERTREDESSKASKGWEARRKRSVSNLLAKKSVT